MSSNYTRWPLNCSDWAWSINGFTTSEMLSIKYGPYVKKVAKEADKVARGKQLKKGGGSGGLAVKGCNGKDWPLLSIKGSAISLTSSIARLYLPLGLKRFFFERSSPFYLRLFNHVYDFSLALRLYLWMVLTCVF